ncbi:hypothetical protein [Clostridium omnivorum]|uniref:Uncharacterized protein n=1 Tax=Clostridium omnivorum TaxID=1604902 RepID=A0ABQ5N456_9CLOT|nr:hypothetical protein [Clostridium sp. E14]GLC29999.1 hypothetical protein bsdE14_14090 [Clostridium sp. E14]
MNAFFIVLGFLVVWGVEVIPIIKEKDMRKVTCYSALILLSLSLSLMILFSNKETSIAAVIEEAMKAVVKYMKI